MKFNIYLWFFSIVPIMILFFTMSYLKINSKISALISVLVAFIISCTAYKVSINQLFISIAKGTSLSLYIILIILGAVILYNIVKIVGGFNVIENYISQFNEHKLLQLLILSWTFAPFMQGVSGFGVPVAIIGSFS